MANKRIKDLSTTAAVTASDDFIAVDGATNGTRKLDAYSPTFGGNLTVSGTGAFGGAVSTLVSTNAENRLSNRNTSAGASAYSSFLLGNDVSPNLGALYALSSGYTTSAQYVADTLVIESSRAAGMAISTTNSGPIKFWHNGVNTATFTSSAATLTGNLTVSGTGTSSVAGKFGVGSTSPNFTGYGVDTAVQTIGGSGSLINGVLELYGTRTTDAQLGHVTFGNSGTRVADIVASRSGANNSARLEFWTASGGALSLNALLGATGNFLLGTTTDSGNGKLQLATHTTSAGGIGFGTDTSLYRAAQSIVAIDGLSTAYAKLRLYESSVLKVQLESAGGDFTLATLTAGKSIKFNSGNDTTALTLDSSQNATFAGSIAIGNTVQTAVAVASTHKVTISIGGVTYYLLATNV